MSILGQIFSSRKKFPTAAEARVECKRLEIRERRLLNEVDLVNKQRDDIFHQGAKAKSPSTRRILARRFQEANQRITLKERELHVTGRSLQVMERISSALERRGPRGGLLEKLTPEQMGQLSYLIEDANVQDEVFQEKMDVILGLTGEAEQPTAEDLGTEGLDVLKTWERMDEGDLDIEDALPTLTRKAREKAKEADAPETA